MGIGLEQELQMHGFVVCTYDTLTDVFGEPDELTKNKAAWKISGHPISIVGRTSESDGSYIYDHVDWAIFGVGENVETVGLVKSILDSKLGPVSPYLTRYDVLRYF